MLSDLLNNTPVVYESDWTTWPSWVWAWGWLVLCAIAASGAVVWIRQALPLPVLAAIIGSAAGVAVTSTAHTILRHLEQPGWGYGLLAALFLTAAGCAVWFFLDGDFPAAVVVGIIAVTSICWAISEAVTRAAAAVPMSIGGLALVVLIVFLWIREKA